MRGRLSIVIGFLALIALGAIALSSPWARNAGTWGNWSDALFTACSAVCVTGLSVVDIAKEYSFVGQIVLIALVEVGALGLMRSARSFWWPLGGVSRMRASSR